LPEPRSSRPFGDLEAAVMDALWAAERPLLVRDVVDALHPSRLLAYTTVMTVLDNLHRKGWLHRDRDGRAWRYRPALTRPCYTAGLMNAALATSDDRAGALAQFVDQIDAADAVTLAAALEQALAERSEVPPA
jgi:predicted transcriptional regulator